ncbi:MAG: AraC family ligand binding domain-containing protein, partial [Planctomycetota bacterium]|nr:AraC family ligand binding domain-containing protein [Planctomycetota bacterium]
MADDNVMVEYFQFRREPSCGSRCIDLGRVHSLPNTPYPPYPDKLPQVYQEVAAGRRLDELHLIYVDSGAGWYTNDAGDHFKITAGTALLLYPNFYHAYSPDADQGWSEYWVGCTGSYPDWLIREDAFRNKNFPIRVGLCQGLGDDFRQLCALAASRQPPGLKAQLLGGSINRLLGRMMALQNRPAPVESAAGATARKLAEYLDSRVESETDMRELPALAGMRYDKLSRLFQDATGMTPHQYYLDRKIRVAAALLRSGLSVKETAYRLS